MSYLQTVSYRKGVSGKKVYTEEVVASTPTAAINAIKNRLGTEIRVDRVLTSVPSNVEGAPPNV
jgi:hypothetical protein|tara:strand:- start:356 stop:547 length:192 start_codon:yes stop_codon:yes gene_type:complete